MKPAKQPALWMFLLPFILLVFISGVRLQYPELSHGDDWGDANALNSGENMARLGIAISHGLPINRPGAQEIQPIIKPYDTTDPLNHFGTYTRIPPLYTIFNAFLRKCGLNDIGSLRLVMLGLSFVSVVFFYLFLKGWLKSEEVASLGTLFYICNPYFISNMDCFHYLVIKDLLRNACLFLLLGMNSCDFKTFRIKYSIIFVLFFLIALSAYEYTVFFGIFLLFWLWINRQSLGRGRAVAIFLLPAAFVLSFLVHLCLVAIHIGSFQEAFLDRITNAISRAFGDTRNIGSQTLDWGAWFHAVGIRFPLQAMVFPFFLIVIGLVTAFVFKTGEKKPTLLQKSLVLSLGLGAAGYAWYLVMPAQCVDHAGLSFFQRHLVPAVAVLFGGILATFLLQLVHSGWKPANAQMAVWALALAGGIYSILGSELPVTREKIEAEQEFEKIVTSLRQVAPKVAYEDYVGLNVFRPTNAFTYYLKARTLHIPNASTFEALEKKPSVFLLVPINDPETQKLADLLSQNYKVAFVADNKRLPFYVFVRNQ